MNWQLLVQLLIVVFLEVALSFDNAAAISLQLSRCSHSQRAFLTKLGLASSLVLRLLLLLSLTFVEKIPYIDLIGGTYLIYIGMQSFIPKQKNTEKKHAPFSIWKTYISIEIMDLLFAIDSLLAAFVIMNIPLQDVSSSPLLPFVYIAIVIGIIVVRIGSLKMSQLFSAFPRLIPATSIIVINSGIQLIAVHFELTLYQYLFWCIIIVCLIYGFSKKLRSA